MKTVVKQTQSIKGIAKVVRGQSKLRITFQDENKSYEDGEVYTIPFDEAPDYAQEAGGEYYATVSGDGKTLFGLRPIRGAFKTKFNRFLSREGEPPAPMPKDGKWGTYLTFIAILKIVDEKYRGMEIPVSFIYNFIETDDDLTAVQVGTKKGNAGERLVDFLEIAGVGDAQIKFSDNVLPRLQKKLLEAGKTFVTALKDGQAEYFMESLTPKAEEDDDEDEKPPKARQIAEEDEDERPPKKSVRKSETDKFDDDEENIPF